jgi:hypothetical protein
LPTQVNKIGNISYWGSTRVNKIGNISYWGSTRVNKIGNISYWGSTRVNKTGNISYWGSTRVNKIGNISYWGSTRVNKIGNISYWRSTRVNKIGNISYWLLVDYAYHMSCLNCRSNIFWKRFLLIYHKVCRMHTMQTLVVLNLSFVPISLANVLSVLRFTVSLVSSNDFLMYIYFIS